MNSTWYVYIVQCKDGTLYTGLTIDIVRRLKEHNEDNIKGAKSLRGKRPVKLVYFEEYNSQSDARKREAKIKNWKREHKLLLIERNKRGFTP